MPWQPAINRQRKAIRKNFIKEGKGKQFGQIFSIIIKICLSVPLRFI